ncbi:MAG: 16S rRNA (uracil(1498)-N(3))-methyltransferase [Firmicutes bacterium]|nr:16S rRNA (uracil(1498)-N(3))-methyltransferase [Bacillota bacterium]
MQRYFVDNKEFKLNSGDIHHIKNVMRMNVGELIEVINDEKLYICKITEIDKDKVSVSVVEEKEDNNELSKHITIAFSITKEDKIDLILQKCTELGIKEFIPVEMSRCNIKIDKSKVDKKVDRWNLICKEAAEQSKRNIIPKVNKIHKLKDLINLDYDLKILCSVNQGVINIKNVLHNNTKCDKIIFVIGPEGGISSEEENFLIENNFIPTSLGRRVLRTETAPIVIGSMLNYEYME